MPEPETTTTTTTTVTGRLRKASITAADAILNFNPQPGMWAATGTAIAYAPTLTELREPLAGGENIEFNEHGHSARTVMKDEGGIPVLSLTRTATATATQVVQPEDLEKQGTGTGPPQRRQTLAQQAETEEKHNWKETLGNGFKAAWRFVSSPTGFLMTIYGLNIVAWGAMLFFVLLGAAPAMNHPSKDALNSPRKKWIEIDSQILNALFCVTGFGLAPWRFRDLYWLIRARRMRNRYAMKRLAEQNKAWFRPPAWYFDGEGGEERGVTFTGEYAPATRMWKLAFVVWMMVWNTLFQAVLAAMMWGFNRFNRPTWSTGTFIGLGCGVSLMAGLMMWWEGRKVKKIEGPAVKIVEREAQTGHFKGGGVAVGERRDVGVRGGG
ncbi:uncharacterized protein LY89DRAFT_709173 [Mollisia scopiformis]|uniref:Uncharacterized protein n=1 Tax=Mollisia scopiformis TaxID=149040 RepID=A0A194WZG3_MOLSC|nr:uncharacterized protein LY89DRAFT_709173 [Mollisia scopiformis]KUJ13338.1 hypothetical protein LY89DRAFT_709173 [Mollisia scopiformis]